MKKFILLNTRLTIKRVVFGFLALTSLGLGLPKQADARDLTYRFGAGFRQTYVNLFVDKNKVAIERQQINGIEASFGIARDFQAAVFFGTTGNFRHVLVGPRLRYDLQRLFSRDEATWTHLNVFTEASFFIKTGTEVKTGLTMHLPYLGFEILPFANNGLAISASGGLVLDFIEKSRVGFTQGTVGADFGLKYYF